MRPNLSVALALSVALGAAAGIQDPIGESRRSVETGGPKPTHRSGPRMTKRVVDPAKRKARNKQARKARAKNRR